MQTTQKETLFTSRNLDIEFNATDNFIYANWKGFQNVQNVKAGCEQILLELKKKNAKKVFNDNSKVTGPFQGATEWAVKDWFPRMFNAGLKYFAWVVSSNVFSQLSVESTVSKMETGETIKTFDSFSKAEKWLKEIE